MPSDIFQLKEPDTYAVAGWDVTPYGQEGWPEKLRRVAVPTSTLLWARDDILRIVEVAPAPSEVRPYMPGPMQLPDGTVVIEGVSVKHEAVDEVKKWDSVIGPTEEIVLTCGAVLRVIAERLRSVPLPLNRRP